MISSVLLLIIFVILIQYSDSDTLYTEGFYDFEALPGGGEYLSQPNTPFSTNTRRSADGVSSTSAYSSTSPRFRSYKGASADVEDRYLHYVNYESSAAEQGVAMYGAGDQQKENAKLKIISQPGYEHFPAPSTTFTVYAPIKWNPTDFAIQEGEYYNITVGGNQTGFSDQFWYDGGIRVNAAGYSSYYDAISNCYVGMGRCRPHLKKTRRLKDANWMSLGCGIGEFVRALTEIEPGQESSYRWMPLDESALVPTLFDVGLSITFRAVYSGQLICFANDAHTLYWNNRGNISVTVTRASWPPTLTLTYEDLLLPACDSAQVVYVNHGDNTYTKGKKKCNPNGGGSGWSESAITSTAGTYGSGAPRSVYADLPSYALD